MATIKDVAEIAQVTTTTVSRVINNRGYISEATRNKVYDAMKQLNYQPNELARSLFKQRTNTIGIIVPNVSHPYFSKLTSYLESAAEKKKYKIILCNSNEIVEKEMEYLDMCLRNRVMGIVLCSGNVELTGIENLEIPVICFERNSKTGMIGLQCDNDQGGRLAAEHLIECGCKNILHFSGIVNEDMPADAREKGFTQVCEQHGIRHYERKHDISIYNTMDYYEYIKQAILELPEVDGIFASSDLIAAQVIQVCYELGIKIPEQMKLVGFDDVDIARLTTPTITTIHQPVKEMAEKAIDLIEKQLEGSSISETIIYPVELVKRKTT